jgi:hypothetical protein
MLAVAMLFASVVEFSRPSLVAQQRSGCPTTPAEAISSVERACAALEVSGVIADGNVELGPAFDVVAPSSAFARQVPGPAKLSGYSSDGRLLFDFTFDANGAFKLILPLSPQYARAIARLTLTAGTATYQRTAASFADPTAEAISTDDSHVVFAWNAQEFPEVRIAEPSGALILDASGNETYQQIALRTNVRRFIVSFSNGVQSVDRTVAVFGR